MPLWLLALCLSVSAACRDNASLPTPQIDGQLEVSGLSAPVRIVRDRWGVPHIHAESQNDLFIAQGFVQAQDRLFQMDLWRRSVQGRLSEVLGSNFAGRDAMTRRIQYRGDMASEWASYGADTQAIARAFVHGVNAFVALAREQPAEEFRLAGWTPDEWSPADLLNRTDAFLASGDALEEVERKALSYVIGDALRRVGTAPFFIGLEGAAEQTAGAQAPAVPAETDEVRRRSQSVTAAASLPGGALTFSETNGALTGPSTRYVVHLRAPGWNVAGLTRPWLPGVAVGHNERVAWAAVPFAADTQDLDEAPLDAIQTRTTDTLAILGRNEPLEFETQFTARGVVVTTDKERGVAYSLRWSGSEPGTAAELAALALNRAGSVGEFRSALARWKLPVRRFVFVDTSGIAGTQVTPLLPEMEEPSREAPAVDTQAVFAHVLGINQATRRRFNIGPVTRPADDAPVRGRWEPLAWDRSLVMNAPGQSESPVSPHAADLAPVWSAGEMVPLVFSDAEIQANAAATLTLVPKR